MSATIDLLALARGHSHGQPAHATPDLAEADRLMTVCNSCRYCEGLCAVFPAMEKLRAFPDGDLNYLANLCHACGACYHDCQFSPPHEFAVNVPATLARVRADSYAQYARPRAARVLFAHNGWAVGGAAAIGIVGFAAGLWLANGSAFAERHVGVGAFYDLMPHNAMALVFGVVLLAALVAVAFGLRAFLADINEPARSLVSARPVRQALRDAATLRYLDGGGVGCYNDDDRPTDRRRLWHHLTAYGFLLCLASTSTATLYHYLLAREAPYPWWDLPVVLGTLGGIGLAIGPIGLFRAKLSRDRGLDDATPRDQVRSAMDIAFIAILWSVGVSGLALLLARATSALGPLLAVHLGLVLALFVTIPYGKMVHGVYRLAALIRSAREQANPT